jgi:hypothetical protein
MTQRDMSWVPPNAATFGHTSRFATGGDPTDDVHQAWDLSIRDGNHVVGVCDLDRFIRCTDEIDRAILA